MTPENECMLNLQSKSDKISIIMHIQIKFIIQFIFIINSLPSLSHQEQPSTTDAAGDFEFDNDFLQKLQSTKDKISSITQIDKKTHNAFYFQP
jgi:hypothetical protein